MSLVRENSVALYRQIADHLRAEMASGAFEPTGRLPSEAEIGARFAVSRVTVRLALEELEREALIDRRKGKGTFVAGRQVRHRIDTLRSFHESLKMQGLDATMQIVELARVDTPASLRDAMGLRCSLMERLHLVNGDPIAFARSFLPLAISSLDRTEAERQPAYSLLDDHDRGGLVRADIAIGAHAGDSRVSTLLRAPEGTVFLVMERTSFFGDGACAERSEFFIRPERYRFILGSGGAASSA